MHIGYLDFSKEIQVSFFNSYMILIFSELLKIYMVINFKTRKINKDRYKQIQMPSLIKKKSGNKPTYKHRNHSAIIEKLTIVIMT